MTRRAFLWCGYARPPRQDHKGRTILNAYDFVASKNDIAIAILAARALGIADREIYPFLCDDGLLPSDFSAPVYGATEKELRRVTQRTALQAGPEDPLLFVASNHGVQEGLLMAASYDELGDDTPLHLTPAALQECLSRLTGPQLVIVATCHSGTFLQLGARANRLVVTACNEHEKYLVTSDDEDAHSPILRTLLSAWCGVAPGDRAAPAPVSLDAAFDVARAVEMARSDIEATKRTEPRRNGAVNFGLAPG